MLNILKALISTKWGKQKEVIVSIFKASLAPFWNMQTPYGALSYQTPTSRNCKPFKTQLCKLLLAAYRYKHSTLHDETKVLSMNTHLKLHASQLKQLIQTQTHSLHDLNVYLNPPRNMKATIFLTMSTLTSSSQNQT